MRFSLILVVLLPVVTLARRAFPVGTERDTEKVFREINPNIKWDDTNYLVDEAGPYAICSNSQVNGILAVPPKPIYSEKFGANGVGALAQAIPSSGNTVSYVRKDIEKIIYGWIKRYPFIDQIKEASVFGCSVEPSCPSSRGAETLVVCLFSPKSSQSGDQGGDKPNPEDLKIRAIAFTDDEYYITEDELRKINPSIEWDRSYFLENLSGTQTSCAMINKNSWDASKAQEMALAHKQYKPDFIFGSTPRNGNTDEAVRELARGWLKRERDTIERAEKVGCSLAIGCRGRDDILVASCLVKPRA